MSTINLEEQRLREVARQYESEGFQVVIRPRNGDLPTFASGLDLDMIATRGNEHVVVEVKRARADLEDDPHIKRLSEIVNAQPGWRFDLIVLEPETAVDRFARRGEEPSTEQILGMIDRAEHVAAGGDLQSAYVVAWAALEAAMRQVRSDFELYGPVAPNELIRTLYSNGVFSREEFNALKDSYSLRNSVVHGFMTPDIDRRSLFAVTAIARKLLADVNGDESASGTAAG